MEVHGTQAAMAVLKLTTSTSKASTRSLHVSFGFDVREGYTSGFFLTHTEWQTFLVFNLHLYWQIWFLKYNIAGSVGKVLLPFKNIYFALMSWSGQLFPSYMIWLCKLWKIGDLIHTTPPFDVPFLIGNDLTNPLR